MNEHVRTIGAVTYDRAYELELASGRLMKLAGELNDPRDANYRQAHQLSGNVLAQIATSLRDIAGKLDDLSARAERANRTV